MGDLPASLNLDQLKAAIAEHAKRLEPFGTLQEAPSFFPDPGIIGILMRDPQLHAFDAGEVKGIADTIVGDRGKAVAVLHEDGIIVGFYPGQNMTL